jgi:PAS domain S-box-containing protein
MNKLFKRRTIFGGYLLALALITFFTLYTWRNMKKAGEEGKKMSTAIQLQRAVEAVLDDAQKIESSHRGYLITGNTEFLKQYSQARADIEKDSLVLRNLTIDSPRYKQKTEKLLGILNEKIFFSEGNISMVKLEGQQEALLRADLVKGKLLMDSIRAAVWDFEEAGKQLMQNSIVTGQSAARTSTRLFFFITILFFALTLGLYLLTRSGLKKQDASEKNRAYLASLIDKTGDAFFSTDSSFQVVTWNKAAEKLYGYSPDEIIGKPISILFKSDLSSKHIALAIDKMHHQDLGKEEHEVIRKDGSSFFILTSINVIRDEKDRISGYVAIHKDITERRKAEQLLADFNAELKKQVDEKTREIRHVLTSSADAFYVIDKDFRVILINKIAEKHLEKVWGNRVRKGVNILDVCPPDRKEKIKSNFEKAFLGERLEYEVVNEKPGMPACVNVKYTPVTDEEQKVTGVYVVSKDITEQKKAEQSVIESEEKYRTLVERASDGIFIAGPSGHFIVVNPSGCKMSQYSLAELQRMTIYDLAEPEDLEKNPFHFEEMKREEGATVERKMRKKDGTVIDIEVNAKFLSDNRFLAFIRDITERKKAEMAIAESEAKFRAFFENSLDGILLATPEGIVLAANPAACILFGRSEEDMIGKPRESFMDTSAAAFQELLNEGTEKGKIKGETVFRRKDGSAFYAEISSAIFTDAMGEQRLSVIFHDITERKIAEEEIRRSEARYRSLIEQANDYIMISDVDGNLIDVNTSMCRAFGYTREELLKMNVMELVEPQQLKAMPLNIAGLQAGESILRERRMLAMDGTIIEVEANVKMLPDGRAIAIARDIRERKKAEQALVTSEETRRLIMNSALDAIICMDQTGIITDWTVQAENIFGWKKEEVTGKPLAEIIIPEKYREMHRRGLQRYMETREGPVLNRLIEISALNRAGKEFPIELSIIPINQSGSEFFCGFVRDITERITAQRQIEKEKKLSDQIIESLPGLFYLIDEQGNYLRWNRLKETITGYSYEEMSRKNSLDFFEGEEKELILKAIQAGFRNGTTSAEAHIVSRTGTRTLFYFTGIAIEYEGKRCLMGTGIDISDRKKAEAELEASYEAVRKLTGHLQNIREEERAHMAREIHDELGQQLTVLKMDISWLNKKIDTSNEPVVGQKMKDLLSMLDGTVKTVRRISSELRPSMLDDLGLAAAMEWQLSEFEKRSGIRTSFDDPTEDIILPEAVKTCLFRIFQESLTNVARHANASTIHVDLHLGDSDLILQISDDGKGFDKQKISGKRTLGILGMRERTSMIGGSYEIKSSPGKGTIVTVSVPLEKLINETQHS